MVRIVVPWLGTVASVFGFLYTLWPRTAELTTRQAVSVTILAILFVVALGFDIGEHLRHRPKRYKSHEKINRFMQRWISGGGQAVIFTRDMSWANESYIQELLVAKARKSELTICLPEPIALTNELERFGARIVAYPALQYVPNSRFTIINDNKMDARVAIGHQVKGVHVIEEFAAGDHPVFWVAKDLVEVIRKAAR